MEISILSQWKNFKYKKDYSYIILNKLPSRKVTRDKDEFYIVMEGSIQLEDIKLSTLYPSTQKSTKNRKQTLIKGRH